MFKKLIGLVLCFMLIASLGYAVTWETDYDTAIKKALWQEKPICLVFYSDACYYCKKLDNEVLKAADVQELLEKFICVRINITHNRDLARKYRVRGVPVVVLRKPGSKIEGFTGYISKSDFIACLNQYLLNLRGR